MRTGRVEACVRLKNMVSMWQGLSGTFQGLTSADMNCFALPEFIFTQSHD